MTVRVRFAPSPTGYLHIGGARTALFNWLFAKHHGGKFLLRIEDTDRERSTEAAVHAIFESMNWLGLNWDEDVVYQFSRAERHVEVAKQMLAEGKAYYCYCTPEELEEMREQAKASGQPHGYNGKWRDRDPAEAPAGVQPVIRFKTPQEGSLTINDKVQGSITIENKQLDDLILVRANGTPTYMLSVVVDDYDMGITHIIRGDDHITNAFRQVHLYKAMGWAVPELAHIPLIHGPDGAKLSKRHGALGADQYKSMGYLPEAMRNYLLRLGWGHGDDEIISTEQAISWFSLDHIGKSPARLDLDKLNHLNAHYLRHMDNNEILKMLQPLLKDRGYELNDVTSARLIKGMQGLKERAKTLNELADNCLFYFEVQKADEQAMGMLTEDGIKNIHLLAKNLGVFEELNKENIEATMRGTAEELGIKLGVLSQVARVALTGSKISPSLFEIMEALGKDEAIKRLTRL